MDQSLRRKLDRITNILWAGGVTNPVTYIEQISYLIYLKLLDEEETARELKSRLGAGSGVRLFPRQAERYRWSKWRFRSGNDLRDFVRDEVFAYMASLVKDDLQVAEYFRDAVLEIVDPNVLKKASGYRKPPGVEAGAVLDAGSDEPRCWWAPFDAVAENDYNLTASRYKPRVAEAVPDEDPAELIREVLAIEREITAGLEKLLGEVE